MTWQDPYNPAKSRPFTVVIMAVGLVVAHPWKSDGTAKQPEAAGSTATAASLTGDSTTPSGPTSSSPATQPSSSQPSSSAASSQDSSSPLYTPSPSLKPFQATISVTCINLEGHRQRLARRGLSALAGDGYRPRAFTSPVS
jgi:hypothetical protein